MVDNVNDLVDALKLDEDIKEFPLVLELGEREILYNYIKDLERQIKVKDAWAGEIIGCLYDYDGCENSIPGLRGLVDEAIDKSEKIMSCDDKSIVMSGSRHDEHGNKYVEHLNVLHEVLTEFTEEDQKWIDSEEYQRFWFGGKSHKITHNDDGSITIEKLEGEDNEIN